MQIAGPHFNYSVVCYRKLLLFSNSLFVTRYNRLKRNRSDVMACRTEENTSVNTATILRQQRSFVSECSRLKHIKI